MLSAELFLALVIIGNVTSCDHVTLAGIIAAEFSFFIAKYAVTLKWKRLF